MQIKFGSGIARLATLAIAAASFVIPAQASAAIVLNRAPVISGAAPTKTLAGKMYSFQASAADADNDTLTFSVTSKPAWARLDQATGRLYGMPTNADAGIYEEIEITVTDGKARTRLPKFALTVVPDARLGRAPTISGTPITVATPDKYYTFKPATVDLDGDRLTFSITGRPSWATLNTRTGRLSGTPTAAQAGTYAGIEITVSDGIYRTKLPKFAITVAAPPIAAVTRSLRLSWTPPLLNVDGSALTNLSGYQIMYGTTTGDYTQSIDLNTVGVTSYMIENLASGKYFIVVKAKTNSGNESAPSLEATIDLT